MFRAPILILFFFVLYALPLKTFAESASNFYLPTDLRGFHHEADFSVDAWDLYDSETESDYLTYSPVSCTSQYLIKQRPDFFCSSLGSLSGKRFLVDNYFVMGKRLAQKADFRFQWVKDQNYTEDTNDIFVEFLFPFSAKHAFGIHGQMDSQKSADDAGLSYNLSSEDLFIRVEGTAFDFSRNNRNEDADRFIQKPYSATLSILMKNQSDLYFLRLHAEPKFIWDTTANEISRSRNAVEIMTSLNGTINTLEFSEEELSQGSNFQNETLWRFHWQRELRNLTPGFRFANKNWETEEGDLSHHDFLGFIWHSPEKWQNWLAGYEFTWHEGSGDIDLLRKSGGHGTSIEHRLNLAWRPLHTETAEFKLLLTFDLDRFGSGETWEGGNGQLTWVF